MGVCIKLKRLLGKKKTTAISTVSTADTTTCGAAGSSSVITATGQSLDPVMSPAPPTTNTPLALPDASVQPGSCTTVALSPSDKFEPWAQAYALFEEREPQLMEDYKKHLASLHDVGTDGDLSTSWSVKLIVERLLENREKKQWQVSLLGKQVKIREQSEKLAKFLLWSSPIVQSAVSTQPYAALAWSGVSLLLPLLTSGTASNEAMLKGFNSIGEIQVYWEICEKTYLKPSNRSDYQDLMEPLIKLYSHIVEYQARAICHLSSAQLSRAWRNVAGSSDWDGKITEIDDLSKQCSSRIQPLQAEETRKQCNIQLQEMRISHRFLDEIWGALETSKRQAQMHYEDQNERALLQDLASNYEGYKNFNRPRVQGTCEWFFADERFRNWRDSITSGLLWVSAGPGCGKSVLSRALIDERRLSTQVTTSTVCHFFFKDGDERRMNPTDALCAILHQLFLHDPSGNLIQHGLVHHRSYGKSLTGNWDVLWSILEDCASSPDTGEIVCVIDALDECEKNGQRLLINQLKKFSAECSSKPLSKLKFLITSRPYDDIEKSFNGFSGTAYLRFDGDQKSARIGNEIDLVIDARVNEFARDFQPSDRQLISTRLKSMKQRTYLWLQLTFDIIENSSEYNRLSDVEEFLDSLPSEVSDAYEKILERSKDEMRTEILLEIVLAAARPLTLDEANEALTLAFRSGSFTSYSDLTSHRWPEKTFESTVKNLCGLFVSVYDSKLSFIHQTAREFLIHNKREGKWQGRLTMLRSHKMMTMVSLDYLSLVEDQLSDWEVLEDPLLSHYSAKHWVDHARPVETEKDVQERILRFFSERTQDSHTWSLLFDQSPNRASFSRDCDLMAAPLCYASSKNLHNLVELLLDTVTDINARCGRFGTALQVACYQGHTDVARLLLDGGADLEIAGTFGTALQMASERGHTQVLQLLLNHGACADVHGGQYGNALQAACYKGHVEIAQLLLDNGADVNAQGGEYGNALLAACYEGQIEIAQLLLDKGADINAQDCGYGSALQAACYEGQVNAVQLLLDKGADVNAHGGNFGTALQAACYFARIKIVQLLLDSGADVNARGGEYGNALQAACIEGGIDITQLLLDYGADVNSSDNGGILQALCYEGYGDIMQLLLDNGADINAQGGGYGTALQAACYQGQVDNVQLLLANGADVNAHGGKYGNALQAACLDGGVYGGTFGNLNVAYTTYRLDLLATCYAGHIKIVQRLLDSGADVNAHGGKYGNALQAACYKGQVDNVQLLLDSGADVNAHGGKYGNALQATCYAGRIEIVQLLLANDADVNAQGGKYGNALLAACIKGGIEIVRLLLDRGADFNAGGEKYGNALQAACCAGQIEIVQLLLDSGADANAQGGEYGNALLAACYEDQIEIAQLLIENGADINVLKRELEAGDEKEREEQVMGDG